MKHYTVNYYENGIWRVYGMYLTRWIAERAARVEAPFHAPKGAAIKVFTVENEKGQVTR